MLLKDVKEASRAPAPCCAMISKRPLLHHARVQYHLSVPSRRQGGDATHGRI